MEVSYADMTKPSIEFKAVGAYGMFGTLPALFGAKCLDWGPYSLVCGGLGQCASLLGRNAFAVSPKGDGSFSLLPLRPKRGVDSMPFMVGSAVIACNNGIVVVGGGATCFSMGTFWETGAYSIEMPLDPGRGEGGQSSHHETTSVGYVETRRVVSSICQPLRVDSAKALVTEIPRTKMGPGKAFEDVLFDARPVIIEGLDMGACVRKWNPQYLVEQIGGDTEVDWRLMAGAGGDAN